MTKQITDAMTPTCLHHAIQRIFGLGLSFALCVCLGLPAVAQSPFSAAVSVNDSIVTHYEIEQRMLFLETLRTPGDLREIAIESLVNERLQVEEARRMGVVATAEEIEAGVAEFAARADLGPEQFIRAIGEEGVAPETFRDFVANGITWRNVVRERFRPRVQISDEDVAEAMLLATDPDNAQILVAEIIVPLTPQNEDRLEEEIGRLSQDLNGDIEMFSEAARRFSAAATREDGGVTGWRPLSAVPSALLEALIFLPYGSTTEPVSLGNAFAIFQMRGLRETGLPAPQITLVDYATIPLPGPQTEDGAAAAAALRAEVDMCDDLYGTRPGGFERETRAPGAIPTDIALALSALDAGEISFDVARDRGAVTLAVMLCGREVAAAEGAEEAVRRQLFGQELESYADGLLAQLHAEAIIDYTP
jgi:peptidyl-prolyl cis-trans isomerase SurA